jgi:hypothetical protein
MSICPNCNKRIEKGTANKIKIRGTWVHKECPEKRAKRIKEKKRLAVTEATR